jgi:adenylate cyclase
MSGERVERRLAAVLAVDVAGYSRLMGQDEEGTLAALRTVRREVSDPKIGQHHGRIVKTMGDGLLVEFQSVVDAVRCAVEVQRAMAERNAGVPADKRIEFRVGIHQGDIIVEDGDIFGDGVNLAARLEGLAEPGGICVSRVVHEEIRDKLDVAFDDLGDQQVKNFVRPVRVLAVRLGGAAAPDPGARAALPLPDRPSLVVLPFQNMTGDPEQEYFVDGMVEEITTAIARLPQLFVIARNSSFAYKGRAVDVKQVARELGVRYVLEGSVRKSGERVRITGQLIDTATSAHIWADRFDGTLDDIFELQDQVASSVAGVIEPKLRLAEVERATRKPTENLDAYDLYLRALAQNYMRTREGMGEAVRLAHLALERDPAYGPAMSLIAISRGMQKLRYWIEPGGAEAEEGIRLARQSIIAAGDDPLTLGYGGMALSLLTGDNGAALSAVDRAIALNPNFANGFGIRALILAFSNRPEEAILSAEQAIRLSPFDPAMFAFHSAMTMANHALGRYEEGLRWAEESLRANIGIPGLRQKLSLCGHLGRHDEAKECLRQLREIHPDTTIGGISRSLPRGYAPELVARFIEGLRKAGVPES